MKSLHFCLGAKRQKPADKERADQLEGMTSGYASAQESSGIELFGGSPLQTSCSEDESEPEIPLQVEKRHFELMREIFSERKQQLKGKDKVAKETRKHGSTVTPIRHPISMTQLREQSVRRSFDKPTSEMSKKTHRENTHTGANEIHLASVLKELTNTIDKVVGRMDKQEKRMGSVEKQLKSVSSSGSSSSESSRRLKDTIPLVVRSEVRRIYRTLSDEDDNFSGFDVTQGVSFKDQVNVKVVEKLIKEVQASNPSFQAGQIRTATYTYYRTLNQESSLQRRGMQIQRKVVRRRRERISRKLTDRLSTLEKSTISEKDKHKWKSVFIRDFMSSEDSDCEEDVLVKHLLPWRSNKVTDFFYDLDKRNEEAKSNQSKRQKKDRVLDGKESSRRLPQENKFPSWAVIRDQ